MFLFKLNYTLMLVVLSLTLCFIHHPQKALRCIRFLLHLRNITTAATAKSAIVMRGSIRRASFVCPV